MLHPNLANVDWEFHNGAMVLAPDIDRSVFEATPPRRKGRVWLFFEVKVSKKDLLGALNEVANTKSQLVDAGKMDVDRFARELEHAQRQYGLEFTPEGYSAVAERFSREGKHEKAIKYFRLASVKAPENADLLTNLGVALGRAGRHEESVRVFREVLALRPNSEKALNNLGASLGRLEKIDEALEALEKAIKIAPKYATPYLNKGNTLCQKGDHAGAIECFQKALALPNPPVFAHVLAGYCLMEIERNTEAVTEFDRAIARNLRDPAVVLYKALALAALGRKSEVSACLATFESDPQSKTLMKDPRVAAAVKELHRETDRSSGLAGLVDSLEIDLPENVNFADWEQLSSHLASLSG